MADDRPTAEHLGGEVERDPVARPGEEVYRHDRLSAHGVDVREGVRGSDPAPVERVVDDGGEEVRRHDDGSSAVNAHDGRVVPMLQTDDEVVPIGCRPEVGENVLELTWRDLASTPASGGVLG